MTGRLEAGRTRRTSSARRSPAAPSPARRRCGPWKSCPNSSRWLGASYCGAIGWMSVTGAMDTSIAIRTVTLQGGRAYFHAGGGIVVDSVPAQEYQETLDKAAGIRHAFAAAP